MRDDDLSVPLFEDVFRDDDVSTGKERFVLQVLALQLLFVLYYLSIIGFLFLIKFDKYADSVIDNFLKL